MSAPDVAVQARARHIASQIVDEVADYATRNHIDLGPAFPAYMRLFVTEKIAALLQKQYAADNALLDAMTAPDGAPGG